MCDLLTSFIGDLHRNYGAVMQTRVNKIINWWKARRGREYFCRADFRRDCLAQFIRLT